jgi:myosin-1
MKRGDEGWAPHNYLKLVPPRAKPAPIPSPPLPARGPVPKPVASTSYGATTKPAVPWAREGSCGKPQPPTTTGNAPVLAPKPSTGGPKSPMTRPPAKKAAYGGGGSAPGQMETDLAAAAVRHMFHFSKVMSN